jgi:murein DD-endopeptidase MepM/ murein hydrolase activator NlpD
MIKVLSGIKSHLLCEREIICVSKNGINSKKIGSIFLVWNVLLVLWTSFATIKYFELREKIVEKEFRITELNSSKQRLLSSYIILEKDIGNVKKFIGSLNKYDRFASVDNNKLYDMAEIDISSARIVLDRVRNSMKNINLALINRINGLENVKNQLNVNNNIQRVSFDTELDIDSTHIDKDLSESIVLNKSLVNNLEHLNNLESFLNDVPLQEPIQTNYISSKFGKRLDPFLKISKDHHGVDLVGPYMARIYAPARGKVVFVGTKQGYGKTIIIEHQNDIRTVYAHLHSFSVKPGEEVKRGDVIGVQGNTGRSTGHHLHYEILQGKQRYDPMNFIRVGGLVN